MKRTFNRIITAMLISVTVLAFTGCSAEDLKSVVKGGADILETAYFYDEDSGVYEAVCIMENNSNKPVKEGLLEATAYDKDGNRIQSVKKEGADYYFVMSYNWLSEGEKTAALLTNAGFENEEGMSILDHYTEVPASLEWSAVQGGAEKDSDLAPHGLSVKACEPDTAKDGWFGDDSGVYNVTLHNDSETDYVFNEDEFCYQMDSTLFSFKIVAVYRDSEGEIKDVEMIQDVGLDPPSVIPAGGDIEMEGLSAYKCDDDSLTPEYYVYIDLIYDK